MNEMINVKINDKTYSVEKGTTLEELLKQYPVNSEYEVLLAKVDNNLKELTYKLNSEKTIEFLDLTTQAGNRTYISGLIFVLIVAIKELYGKEKDITVEHSLDKGLYIESNFALNSKKVMDIEEKMKKIVAENRSIKKVIVDRMEAIKYFKSVNDKSKEEVIKYNTNTYITLYHLGNYYNYFYNKMPIRTGVLNDFKLNYVKDNGFMLRFKTVYIHDKIADYTHHENMFKTFNTCKDWAKLMNVENASQLNKVVSNGKIDELIRICENKQNNEFIEIAQNIVENKSVKVVLMAGPSSSGKTTSSKKLCLALKSLGKNPSVISMDDYFVEREENPIDKDGKPDYECLEAIDLKLFDSHVEKLFNKEKVLIPTYNFITGKKEYKKQINLEEDDILVIEGIHALDNRILNNIPKNKKYVREKRDYGKAASQIFGGILCLTIIRTSRIRTTSAITAQRTTPRIQPILRIPRIIRIPRTPRILRTPEMNTKTATTSRTAVTIQATAADSNGNRGGIYSRPFCCLRTFFN